MPQLFSDFSAFLFICHEFEIDHPSRRTSCFAGSQYDEKGIDLKLSHKPYLRLRLVDFTAEASERISTICSPDIN